MHVPVGVPFTYLIAYVQVSGAAVGIPDFAADLTPSLWYPLVCEAAEGRKNGR